VEGKCGERCGQIGVVSWTTGWIITCYMKGKTELRWTRAMMLRNVTKHGNKFDTLNARTVAINFWQICPRKCQNLSYSLTNDKISCLFNMHAIPVYYQSKSVTLFRNLELKGHFPQRGNNLILKFLAMFLSWFPEFF
jgi:hypothetical protein